MSYLTDGQGVTLIMDLGQLILGQVQVGSSQVIKVLTLILVMLKHPLVIFPKEKKTKWQIYLLRKLLIQLRIMYLLALLRYGYKLRCTKLKFNAINQLLNIFLTVLKLQPITPSI